MDRRVVFERAWNSNDNDGQSNPNEWQHSDAQNWCSTFATNTDVFSTAEQAAFLGVTKTDNSEGSLYSSGWGTSSLTENDKVFFLSVRELADYVGNYDGAPGLRATDTAQSAGAWWLRSPYANYAFNAGLVAGNGLVSLDFVYNDWAVRPAFNLNLNSVLFTSAAVGGKSANGMDSGLTAVDDYAGSEWKLTLLDETREFAVTEQTVSGKPGDTITLNYTGATTGENEYISVIIADENGAQYYGRVAQPGGESGTATLSIPADLAPGSYTLNVFSEQYNGDYKTDYASAFAEVALTVEEAAAPGIDTGKAIQLADSGTAANIGGGQADNIYFGTYQQSSDGSGGYNTNPVKWRVLSNASGQLFLLSDQNLDVFQYHTDSESVTWEKSTMRSWLNGYGAAQNTGSDNGIDYTDDNFIDTAFSDGEQGAIVDTTVVNDDNPDYNTEGGENTNDKIFLLSVDEARNSSYFADDNSRKGTNTAYVADGGKIDGNMFGVGAADYWWLRSPGDDADYAAGVIIDGGVYSNGFNVYSASIAVRPAFNLDLTSVLFTSAAVGGKSANGMDSGLTAIGNYDGSEWKLTLLDETREFAVTEQTSAASPAIPLRSITPGRPPEQMNISPLSLRTKTAHSIMAEWRSRAEKAERRPFPFLPTLRPEVIPLMCSASSITATTRPIMPAPLQRLLSPLRKLLHRELTPARRSSLWTAELPQISAADGQTTFILAPISRAVPAAQSLTARKAWTGSSRTQPTKMDKIRIII